MSYITNETRPRIVERPAENIPQTAQTPYFTASGKVIVTQLIGEVTDTIENTGAINADLWSNPTVGADVAICTVLDIANGAIGTMYNITGTPSDALAAHVSGSFIAQASAFILPAGTLDLKTLASKTGITKWTLHYIPFDRGATVIVTP